MLDNEEPYKMELRAKLNKQMLALKNNSSDLEEFARLFDAEQFLDTRQGKKEHGDVVIFHFKEFVDQCVEQELMTGKKITLPESVKTVDSVILPTNGEPAIVKGGGVGMEKKKRYPRWEMVLETLQEMGVKYEIISGIIEQHMVREEGYLVFVLPENRKVVFVNNEEGNATYIIHYLLPGQNWKTFAGMTKEALAELSGGQSTKLIYDPENPQQWNDKVKELLNQVIEPRESQAENTEDVISDKTAENYEAVKEGELTINALAKKTNSDFGRVAKAAKPYRATHPEWFNQRHDTDSNRRYEYLSRELVDILIKEIPARPEITDADRPKEGEMTISALARKKGVGDVLVYRKVLPYRNTRPDWFNWRYDNSRNRQFEYLSPELVEKIEEEIPARPEITDAERPKDGEMTIFTLTKKLDANNKAVYRKAFPYRTTHPEWFRWRYDNDTNHLWEYLSPELVAILIKEIPARPEISDTDKPRDGEMAVRALAEKVGTDSKTVSRMTSDYRTTHPEWFNWRYNSFNRRFEYLSPELVKIITEYFDKK